jgi:hypothetical protein
MGADGTYGFVYYGNRGLGMSVFSINGEQVVGRDLAGSVYDGTAVQDADGNIVLDVQMQIPAGVTLVPQDIPHARQICWTLLPAFGDGEPQMVEFAGPSR